MLAAAVMLAACGRTENGSSETTGNTTAAATTAATSAAEEVTETEAENMVQSIYQAIVEAYGEEYYPEQQMQQEAYFMQDTLGLEDTWYDAAVVELPMMSVNVDMLAVVHPTEGNLEKVEKALEDYQSHLINNTMQYPMNVPKVQGSVLKTVGGEYVIFSILTGRASMDYESADESLTEEQLAAAEIEAYRESSSYAVEIAEGVVSGEITVVPWTELDKLRNAVVKAYGSAYHPTEKVHAEKEFLPVYLKDTLKLDPAWLDDIIIEIPAVSTSVDTLILADPSDGNEDRVLNALKEYKNYLVNASIQYPMNKARVESAVVEELGGYVCFVILGNTVDDAAAYGFTSEEELTDYYTSMNENAVYAIQNYLGLEE